MPNLIGHLTLSVVLLGKVAVMGRTLESVVNLCMVEESAEYHQERDVVIFLRSKTAEMMELLCGQIGDATLGVMEIGTGTMVDFATPNVEDKEQS
jgi:hypothetical protein